MKVTVMTLSKSSQQLDLQPSQTIFQVKEQISTFFPSSPSNLQKLIYAGRILKDEDTVEACGIREGEKIVLMISKPPSAAPKQAAVQEEKEKITASARIEPSASAQPRIEPAVSAQDEAAIQGIMELGFAREEASKALRAAFGNPDRAVEYLLSGAIPEVEESFGGAAGDFVGSNSAEDLGGILGDLRESPDFLHSLQALQQNPELFNALLTQIGQRNPELLRSIQANPQAFLAGLQALMSAAPHDDDAEEEPEQDEETEITPEMATQLSSGASNGLQRHHNVVQVTPEENEAINRLCDLGFQKARAAEAYFVCDKNEEVAAEYLFEHMNDE